jgi:hypothetical protein
MSRGHFIDWQNCVNYTILVTGKSIENSTVFVNKLSNHTLSFDESSVQAKIFVDAFVQIMFLPGDWHTGMNMPQWHTGMNMPQSI